MVFNENRRNLILAGRPYSLAIKMSIPAIAGMVSVALYSFMDSIFVGQMIDGYAMTAVSVTYPFTLLNTGISALVGVGSASVLSRAIGRRDGDTTDRIMGNLLTTVTMGYYISGIDSDYTGLTALAGSPTVSTLTGSGSTKINDGDEYYLQWNADYIISYRTLDYSIDYTDVSTGVTLTPEETWEKYMEYFKEMDCYENMVYINTSMPVVCRIAYLAEIFYPEIFGEGYGDSVHQEFVDRFMSYLGDDFDVSEDMTCVITYDMVKNKI